MKTIKITSTSGYLEMEDLPHNCIFNKVITGCGGTTVALSNNECYIIAVPTQELIKNKIKRDDAGVGTYTLQNGETREIFGLFGYSSYMMKKELRDYIESHEIKKIMCTYDKMEMLLHFIDPKDYRLLVDEYHTLLKAYSFREKAINRVFSTYRMYKSFCFMSATPIMPDFKPSILDHVEEVMAEWDNVEKITVNLQYSNKPFLTAANIINRYKADGFIEVNGNKSYEAFFFINSVNEICKILKHCNLTNDNARIICADTEDNRKKLGDFNISTSNSANKQFTFITCKSFEGVDYFSDSAISFVVSSASAEHTKLAIDTDIPQIVGRIRSKNNPFRNKIVHIYNRTNKDIDLITTFEEMTDITNRTEEAAKQQIEKYNKATTRAEKIAIKRLINNDLILETEDGIYYNDAILKLDLYNFKVNQIIYKSGISVRTEYQERGIQATAITYNKEEGEMKTENETKAITFKEAYLKALSCQDLVQRDNYLKVDLVKEAIEKLTPEEVRAARYTKKTVKELLISKNEKLNQFTKAIKMIKKEMPYNEFVPVTKVKETLANVYEILGIEKKAKATDITAFFYAKEMVKRINGRVERVICIIRPKGTIK